jgi:lysylphosphatidylglycerol synthetase-like protein (DUF2156 family)
VPDPEALLAASRSTEPTGAGFDIVLLLHIGCVLIAVIAVVISAAQAGRLRALGLANPDRDPDLWTSQPPPVELVRYYRPGPNWAGRVVWGVPIFGFLLLALSHGYYRFSQNWIVIGLVIFIAVAVMGEGWLWPAERQLQRLVTGAVSNPEQRGESNGTSDSHNEHETSMMGPTRTVIVSGIAMVVLMVVATVVMVAQPT